MVVWDRQDPLLFDVYELYYESLNATNSVDSGKVEIASDQDRLDVKRIHIYLYRKTLNIS